MPTTVKHLKKTAATRKAAKKTSTKNIHPGLNQNLNP